MFYIHLTSLSYAIIYENIISPQLNTLAYAILCDTTWKYQNLFHHCLVQLYLTIKCKLTGRKIANLDKYPCILHYTLKIDNQLTISDEKIDEMKFSSKTLSIK